MGSEFFFGAYWYSIPISAETALCLVIGSFTALYLAGANYALKVVNYKSKTIYRPKHVRRANR